MKRGVMKNIWVKITSIDSSENNRHLAGGIYQVDYIHHQGYGVYSIQLQIDGKYYIFTKCRVRFMKKETNPEYFL